jgi:hypothetical protein
VAVLTTGSMLAQPRPSGGNGTLYVGGYPNVIWILDEATEKLSASIQLKHIPRRLTLSRDRTRFYVIDATAEQIEIVDIASRKIIDGFSLTSGNQRVRVSALEPDPLHRYLILITRTATKSVDRVETGNAVLQKYDLQERKIVRTIPWPSGREGDSANLMFSPDGKLLYFLGNETLILETENFTEVDRWDVSSVEEGLGQVSVSFGGFAGLDTVNDEPGYVTTTMTVQDPVQNRRMMGVARVNLAKKELEYYTIGPAGGVTFALAPGGRQAYGLESSVGRYQFWRFDLAERRVVSRMEFDGRPRMSLKTSSNGQLLYIYNAGHTIDVYNGADFKYLRTIALDGDVTTQFYVVPRIGR